MPLVVKFTLEGQDENVVNLDHSPLRLGSLSSNQIVLPAPGIEPIHAMLERNSQGKWILSDLGSERGVKINSKKLDVEQEVKHGDEIVIGSLSIQVVDTARDNRLKTDMNILSDPPPDHGLEISLQQEPQQSEIDQSFTGHMQNSNVTLGNSNPNQVRNKKVVEKKEDLLFSPKEAKPSGDVLEVVAFWDNTILDVDHFHPSDKKQNQVSIGDPSKSNFIAAGDKAVSRYVLAKVQDDGYRLNLLDNMSARLRRGGNVDKVSGGSHTLGRRDTSHIKYGPVKYFFLFVKPPNVTISKKGSRDTLFMGIMSVFMAFFFLFTITMSSINPEKEKQEEDDLWSIVHVPEKTKKIEKPKPKELKIAEVKKAPPPPKVPPKPKPKPVEPVKVAEKAKPIKKPPQPKEVAKVKMQENLTKAKKPTPVARKAAPKAISRAKAGGKRGGGKIAAGGARKGTSASSIKGVAGVKNKKASGVNLSKLGIGVGKISSKNGAGAIRTKFRSTVGGGGGGSGSASKTYGLGGVNSSVKSVGLAGSGAAVNQFGSGSGLIGNGKGGGLGRTFGSGKSPVSVDVRAGDPLVSGGLTQEEILAVIRAQLNQIRHCYEKLLQRSPNAAGKIDVKFIVATNGRVSSATVKKSSISDSSMKGCVTSVVRRWAFPKPRGGSPVTVNYPFSFNPL